MVQAEAKRDEGLYMESAALFDQAYYARSKSEQADQVAEVIVRNAMIDYELAQVSGTNPRLLKAQVRLLEDFIEARQTATRDAQATDSPGVPLVPRDLVEQLRLIESQLAELTQSPERPAEHTVAEPPELRGPPTDPPAAKALEAPEPAAHTVPSVDIVTPSPPLPVRGGQPQRRWVDGALIGVGTLSILSGAGIVVASIWSYGEINRRADERLQDLNTASPPYLAEQRSTFAQAVNEWQQQARTRSVIITIVGSALTATGVGIATWGGIRLRRQRASSRFRASLSPGSVRRPGLVLKVAF